MSKPYKVIVLGTEKDRLTRPLEYEFTDLQKATMALDYAQRNGVVANLISEVQLKEKE